MPIDGVEFDTADFGGESNAESVSAGPSVPIYTPPTGPEGPAENEPDPEKGEGPSSTYQEPTTVNATPPATEAPAAPIVNEPVDLLDESSPAEKEDQSGVGPGGLHELD